MKREATMSSPACRVGAGHRAGKGTQQSNDMSRSDVPGGFECHTPSV